VLTVLLELLVARTRPPLIISRLAGDAVISYGLRDNFLQGQTFVELIEDCYTTFRSAIERMVLNNTCRCNACANIGNLDLKFFVHYGAFGLQRIRDHDELVGSDVNIIHRLLKNHVVEQIGFRAYTLYTAAAIQQLGLTEISAMMTPHAETYEHLGEVKLWIQDMHPVWVGKREAARLTFEPKTVLLKVEVEMDLPPEQVWDYLAQPEHRKFLVGTPRHNVSNRSAGRIGPGSVYQCYHGDHVIPQTILEWRPFERVVTRDLMPIPIPNTFALVEYLLVPTERGTRLSQTFGQATGPWLGRLIVPVGLRAMAKQAQADIDAFKKHVEDDAAKRGALPVDGTILHASALSQAVAESLHTGHDPTG